MAGAPNPFDISRMAIGGIGQMLDGVEFIKRAWSGLNIPSTMVPTVDVEELDKRIADLKAVEQWLNLNLSMLHGTIQGLEIQRGTLAAVKAFGATLGTLPAAAAEGVAARARVTPRPAAAPAAPPAAASSPAAAPASAPARKADAKSAAKADAPADASTAAPAMLPRIDPTAWWNLLQQNFNQVAEAALSGVGLQNAAVGAMRAAGDAAGAIAKATTGATSREPVRDRAAGTGAKRPAAGRAPAKRKRAPAKPRAPKAPS
jgi:hypothetical protein